MTKGTDDDIKKRVSVVLGLLASGDNARAIPALRELLALPLPVTAELTECLGKALKAVGRHQEAVEAFQRAVAAKPDLVDSHLNLSLIFWHHSMLVEAAAAAREAIRIAPDRAQPHLCLSLALSGQGRYEEALAACRQAVQLEPTHTDSLSALIFLLDYDPDITPESHHAARDAWYRAQPRMPVLPHPNRPAPDRPLKVGYVSGDLRNHSASAVFGPIMREHDRRHFSVTAYSNTVGEDARTEQFKGWVDCWRRVTDLSDDQMEALVRADEIDILVDASGHTAGHRLPVFARKPAPVQVSAWGQANGTGLPQMDAVFCDPINMPLDWRSSFCEAIVDLPNFLCLERPAVAPEVGPPPVLAAGYVTFGYLGRMPRVAPWIMVLWAKILAQTPNSRLILKGPGLEDGTRRSEISAIMDSQGIAADRISMLASSSQKEHLAVFNTIDIALDPYPNCGGVGSIEGMWMGVPLVTMAGSTPVSRCGASFYHTLGLDELTTTTLDSYVATAVELADNLPLLEHLRIELPRRLAASPLGNIPLYTRAVEDAYRQLWRGWCAAQK